jgi:N-formylglutamate amidohydrolase
MYRGTQAGLSTKNLVDRFGRQSIDGAGSISGILHAKGYTVNPVPNANSLPEDARFAGGYTVRNYGSHKPNGIDAIQLEFGLNQRKNERFAEGVADALVQFMKSHELLPKE